MHIIIILILLHKYMHAALFVANRTETIHDIAIKEGDLSW